MQKENDRPENERYKMEVDVETNKVQIESKVGAGKDRRQVEFKFDQEDHPRIEFEYVVCS